MLLSMGGPRPFIPKLVFFRDTVVRPEVRGTLFALSGLWVSDWMQGSCPSALADVIGVGCRGCFKGECENCDRGIAEYVAEVDRLRRFVPA